jgi:ABC-2 type transport system permease protein
MGALIAVLKREIGGYFATPLAYVFIVIFLVLCGGFTFAEGMGSFFERQQADLGGFFQYHPWLYLFLIPALSMRLWAEERRSGTIELLLTLPVPTWAAVLGKYLAAWLFTGIALALTFPLWITVNQLGEPDNRAIATSYAGSLLMAGGFLAIGAAVSAATKNQVIAFVFTVVICFVFTMAGLAPVQGFLNGLPDTLSWVPGLVSGFGFMTHFSDFSQGVVNLSAVVFFVSLIGSLLAANVLIVDLNRG